MATLTIRNVPESVKIAFQEKAAAHGRSMEAELRKLIEGYVLPQSGRQLAAFIRNMPTKGLSLEDTNALTESLAESRRDRGQATSLVDFDDPAFDQ